jgi:hypothetical protein
MTNDEIRMTNQVRITNDDGSRSHALRGNRIVIRCIVTFGVLISVISGASAQEKVHYLSSGKLPPGVVGYQQLLRGGPLAGYFQPVEIKAPEGALVSFAIDGQFAAMQPAPLKVGMLVGQVYRLHVMEIPNRSGEEVFPTVEIINRIYPPVGEEFRFPIPIEFTQQDIELALDGKFVTRVVYLEDPERALPVAKSADSDLSFFEVRPTDDPLEVADRLGRPVAIIRLGGRLPEATGPDAKFLFGSPPLLVPNTVDVYEVIGEGARESSDPPPRQYESTRKSPASPGDPAVQVIYPTRASAASSRRSRNYEEASGVAGGLLRSQAPRGKRITKSDPQYNWKLDQPAPVAITVSDE